MTVALKRSKNSLPQSGHWLACWSCHEYNQAKHKIYALSITYMCVHNSDSNMDSCYDQQFLLGLAILVTSNFFSLAQYGVPDPPPEFGSCSALTVTVALHCNLLGIPRYQHFFRSHGWHRKDHTRAFVHCSTTAVQEQPPTSHHKGTLLLCNRQQRSYPM